MANTGGSANVSGSRSRERFREHHSIGAGFEPGRIGLVHERVFLDLCALSSSFGLVVTARGYAHCAMQFYRRLFAGDSHAQHFTFFLDFDCSPIAHGCCPSRGLSGRMQFDLQLDAFGPSLVRMRCPGNWYAAWGYFGKFVNGRADEADGLAMAFSVLCAAWLCLGDLVFTAIQGRSDLRSTRQLG